jgi:hypothetical protein
VIDGAAGIAVGRAEGVDKPARGAAGFRRAGNRI